MKTIAIVQSNYIPWKGYFDMINMVDEFVLFDDVQYTKRDWRNRNQIKTPRGLEWLTVPVEVSGKYYQSIKDTKIADKTWAQRHWSIIRQNYSKAACINDFKDKLDQLYQNCSFDYLSETNFYFITNICKWLEIPSAITWSNQYKLDEGKNEKLISICKQAGASRYISGPAAKNYIDEALFQKEGIEVCWMDYSNYPPYRQLHSEFTHTVSIVDLLLNEGKSAREFMKSFKGKNPTLTT